MKARPLTRICGFCGHKIVGTFADSGLEVLMQEHYRIVHWAELEEIFQELDRR